MSLENVYVCEHCGKVFRSDWTDKDAVAEFGKLFHGDDPSGDKWGVLCDDCWPEFLAWMTKTFGPPPWPADASQAVEL